MTISDITAKLLLVPAHAVFLIPFITVGYFSRQRTHFRKAVFVLLFTLILNPALKTFYHIPLPSHLGEGFAFPSGHMQAAAVFWGCLAFEWNKKWLTVSILFLLTGIGFALIHLNYHNFLDVSSAVLFAMITLIIYHFLYQLFNHKNPAWIGFSLLMFTIPLLYYISDLKPTVWLAVTALLGLSMESLLREQKKVPNGCRR